MGTFTSLLNLYKPADGEVGWGSDVDTNFDILDTAGYAANNATEMWFNVKDPQFGALGNDSANDYAAIAAAIAACYSAGGGIVYFPPGIYRHGTRIDVPVTSNLKSVSLVGAGYPQTTLKYTGSAGIQVKFTASGGGAAQGTEIKGLTFNGNSLATYGLHITDCTMMRIHHCRFGGQTSDGIFGTQAGVGFLLSTISQCFFGIPGAISGYGINLNSANGITVGPENEFYATGGGSLRVNGNGNQIVFNDFEGLISDSTYSINCAGGRNQIIANRFEDAGGGAYPNGRAVYIGSGASANMIAFNDFGEAGAFDYQIETAGSTEGTGVAFNTFVNAGTTSNVLAGSGDSQSMYVFNYSNSGFTGGVTGAGVAGWLIGPGYGHNAYGFNKLSLASGTNTVVDPGALLMKERASDANAPAADEGQLYLKDNGSGKTQLCIRFSSGAVQVIATQP